MATVYQCDAAGYFVGETEDFGGPLPHGCVTVKPLAVAGRVPRWNGQYWDQAENHVGESGYVDGQAFTIESYGPRPAGWRAEPPAPTPEERLKALQGQIATLERQGQRAGREVSLALAEGRRPPAEALERLKLMEAEIAGLRTEIQKLSAVESIS